MKKNCLICLLLCIFLTSCSLLFPGSPEEARQVFSQFPADDNVVLIESDNHFQFTTHELDLYDKPIDEWYGWFGVLRGNRDKGSIENDYWFCQGKMYFSTVEENGFFLSEAKNDSLYLYEYDIHSRSVKLLFEKHGYTSTPATTINNGILYIQYYSNKKHDVRFLDSYDIFSGDYRHIASGDYCSLDDFKDVETSPVYNKEDKDYFEISIDEEAENIIIDNAVIKSSIYADVMSKYGYSPDGWTVSHGHILLVYYIDLPDGGDDSYIIFEYDVEKQELIYKSLVVAFMVDIETIVYME